MKRRPRRVKQSILSLVAASLLLPATALAGSTPKLTAQAFDTGGGGFTVNVRPKPPYTPPSSGFQAYADGWQPRHLTLTTKGKTLKAKLSASITDLTFIFTGKGLPGGATKGTVKFSTKKHGHFSLTAKIRKG